jgi:hypothetical protein
VTPLTQAIENSRGLAVWIGDQFHGKSVKSDDRRRLAAGLISVSMWHHSSIGQLVALGRYASALALIRSEIDCFVRSLWVAYLATDEQLAGFVDGERTPESPKIMATLEKEGIFDLGSVDEKFRALWPIFCDFNHGGSRIVVRHLTSGDIGPDFEEEELVESLRLSDRFVMGACCALADLMEDRDLGKTMLTRIESLPIS